MADEVHDLEANKAMVIRYMELAQQADRDQCLEMLAEDAVRVFCRPGTRPDPVTRGRENIIGNRPLTTLYKPGTLKMEVENILAEGPLVAVQFVMRATTAAGEPYENFYHHLFEIHGGKITKYWEYCDTFYGMKMLRPDELAAAAK